MGRHGTEPDIALTSPWRPVPCHSLGGHSRLGCRAMKKRALMISLLVLAALLTVPATASATALTWRLLPTGTDAQFRGLSAVNRHVAWVSGTRGTVLRT